MIYFSKNFTPDNPLNSLSCVHKVALCNLAVTNMMLSAIGIDLSTLSFAA